jgi:isoleucyl-tRNA synthetase
VYQRLVRPVDAGSPPSVHFADYPSAVPALIDVALERRMAVARTVVTLGRKLREDHRVKVRQPLPSLTVVHRDASVRDDVALVRDVIRQELNVKVVEIQADEASFADVSVKPNFKTLGKRCGPKLKPIGAALSRLGHDEVARLEAGETIVVEGETLGIGDVILQRSAKGDRAVASDGHVTVALDTHVDEALRREGIAREFTSQMQSARKEAGLEVTDRVALRWSCEDPAVRQALLEHAPAIAKEILATDLGEDSVESASSADIDGVTVHFFLKKSENPRS